MSPLAAIDGPVVVVSPHLDDGVFSCGALLAAHPGSTVITIFAGRPERYAGLTDWDARSGFGADDDPVALRRAEDRAALRNLGATPLWLHFCDAQYNEPAGVEAIARALGDAVDDLPAAPIFIPLGLFHSDHRLASEAALLASAQRPERHWFAYADAVYRGLHGLADERLAELRAAGVTLSAPEADEEAPWRRACKLKAIRCYRSQLRALASPGRPGWRDALSPERYWHLAGPIVTTGFAEEAVRRG